jgi:cytochrome c oxidase subunit 4
MHARTISVPTYVLVCAILVALTFLTVAMSFFHVPAVWHTAIGLLIALCKASLVVLFFMHVLVSPKLTALVVIVSVFWLGILLVLTYSDYFSRGLVPNMPGH